MKKEKIRINIIVEKRLLLQAKKKLNLFGGKLSTLFNAYLNDFVKSSNYAPGKQHEEIFKKIKDIEKRLDKIEIALVKS